MNANPEFLDHLFELILAHRIEALLAATGGSLFALRHQWKGMKAQLAEKDARIAALTARVAALEAELARERTIFLDRTEEHHQAVHTIRDLLILLFSEMPIARRGSAPHLTPAVLNRILLVLGRVSSTFQLAVPKGTHVYASLRTRAGLNYNTVGRAGIVDSAARQLTTEPLHRYSPTVQTLYESFKTGECVIVTGKGQTSWTARKNDRLFSQDLSVMAAAVFSKERKKHGDGFHPVSLDWILGVSADQPDAFGPHHKALMRAFGDLFGILLNTLGRLPPGAMAATLTPFPKSPDAGTSVA